MLTDIYFRPYIPSSQRASDLGLSAQASNKIFRYLEKNQLVDVIKLNMTGKRGGLSKFYKITKKGCDFINRPYPKQSGGTGPTHHFIQGYFKKYLPEKSFSSLETEKNIGGKRIDVFGIYENLKIGIEICISTIKTEVINIKKDWGKCDVLIIVTPDKKTRDKLQSELYKKVKPNEKLKICIAHELLNDPDKIIGSHGQLPLFSG